MKKPKEEIIILPITACPFCKNKDEVENKNNVLHCKRCKVFYTKQSLKENGIK